MCVYELRRSKYAGHAMPCNSDFSAFFADSVAVVSRALLRAFPGLDEAE